MTETELKEEHLDPIIPACSLCPLLIQLRHERIRIVVGEEEKRIEVYRGRLQVYHWALGLCLGLLLGWISFWFTGVQGKLSQTVTQDQVGALKSDILSYIERNSPYAKDQGFVRSGLEEIKGKILSFDDRLRKVEGQNQQIMMKIGIKQ